jgi:hypothetical protein
MGASFFRRRSVERLAPMGRSYTRFYNVLTQSRPSALAAYSA